MIAPTTERAAFLAVGFDDVVAATPDEVASLLLTRGHDLPCVVVCGIADQSGRLATLIESALDSCPDDVEFMLEVDVTLAADIREGVTTALRGLLFLDCVELGGHPYLRFRRADDPTHLPRLTRVAELLGDELQLTSLLPARAQDRSAELDGLAIRVAELERDLSAATGALADVTAELAGARAEREVAREALERARQRPWAVNRLLVLARRMGGPLVAGLGLALISLAALATAVAVLADDGLLAGSLIALLGLGAVEVALIWWGDRRLRALLLQSRAATARVTDVARLDRRVESAIADLTAAVVRLERSVAVISASSVDTADSVAKLHDHLRGQAPLPRG